MAVIATGLALPRDGLALSLERYAQLTGYSECALWGVNNPDESYNDCDNKIWTLAQRVLVAKYLAEAQDEIEQVTTFPLAPRWFENEQHPVPSSPLHTIHTRWTRVLAAGVRAEANIALAQAVNHATDPAIVGPVATTVTNADEIHVFHPSSDLEINPSKITIASGNVTLEIPRCRMVKESAQDNDAAGLDYNDTSLFEATVDLKRIYNDASENATLVWGHRFEIGDCASCGCATCGDVTKTGCVYVRNARTGALDVLEATFEEDMDKWTAVCLRCYGSKPDFVRVNYRAGLETLTYQAEDTILRLAHAKMPNAPCGCDVLQSLWARDRNIPQVLTRERENCSFGLSDGAWIAWRFANAMKQWRASVI